MLLGGTGCEGEKGVRPMRGLIVPRPVLPHAPALVPLLAVRPKPPQPQLASWIAGANEEVPEDRRIRFRIGFHVGEVMVRKGDLFGDGVNIAARMQGLAVPGSVCLSEATHHFVFRALPVVLDDLGPQLVKNLDVPIRAYLAHPPSQSLSRVLPPVHRRIDAYLARRFHELCHGALIEITRTENLRVIEYATLASLEDAPGIDQHRLAERLSLDIRKAAGVLKLLESKGLVEATTSTRAFMLTPRGLDIRQ